MPHKPEKLLFDVIGAGRAIRDFTSARDRDAYDGDLMLRSAVERQFEILGEALRRLSVLDPGLAAKISGSRRIIDFRNVISHGYDTLDSDLVWQAITDKLPILITEAETLLRQIDPKCTGG